MSHPLYGKGANGVQSLVSFSEVMQNCEAKFMHFLFCFQITNSELKGKVEISLEKTVNSTFVRISLLVNSILNH